MKINILDKDFEKKVKERGLSKLLEFTRFLYERYRILVEDNDSFFDKIESQRHEIERLKKTIKLLQKPKKPWKGSGNPRHRKTQIDKDMYDMIMNLKNTKSCQKISNDIYKKFKVRFDRSYIQKIITGKITPIIYE